MSRSRAGFGSESAEERARMLAGEVARANTSLTSVQAALADEILRSRTRPVVPTGHAPERAPYKGLLRFEPEDADLFFGREQLVADVLARLSADRLVTVLGASGSGKSSVVRAGVIAELRRGALPGSEHWPVQPDRTPGWFRVPVAMVVSRTGRATDRNGVVWRDRNGASRQPTAMSVTNASGPAMSEAPRERRG